MKLKTSHIIWGSAILIALANGENVRHSLASGNQSRREQSDFSDRIRENRTEARQAARLSKVALDRYRSNCILVVDSATGKENYFQPGTTVLDTQLAQPLRPGVYVCNKLGDTARVTQAGTIADIARVAIPDLAEFRKLLEQQK
jgi:hypothetical protein